MCDSGQTMVEKIMSNHCGKRVRAGDIVTCDVDLIFFHDGNRPLVPEVFEGFSSGKVADSSKILAVIDHAPSSPTESVAKMHAKIRAFCREQKVLLHESGEGICHQLVLEKGNVLPGSMVIGADSHTCTQGAMNAFSSGVGASDLASAMLTGGLWFLVPESIRVIFHNTLPSGVFSKDVVLFLVGLIGASGANYKAIEFGGEGLSTLSIDQRITITNMVIEMGAKCGIMPCDEKLQKWLSLRFAELTQAIWPDEDAVYCQTINIDLSKLEPQIATPHKVDNVQSVKEVLGTPVQRAIIGTCTNGRLEDLAVAAQILEGKHVQRGMTLIVSPASRSVYLKAIEMGYISTLLRAGASIAIPGCSACSGGSYVGVPSDGEAVLTTANRNFKGRLGNPKADIYLASPATVAASALTGCIEDCRGFVR